jgi:hypothetical protein
MTICYRPKRNGPDRISDLLLCRHDATATAAWRRAWGSMIELMYLASSSKCFLDILWLLLINYTAIIQKGEFLVNHKKTLHKVGFTVQLRAYLITKLAASASVYSLGINTASAGGGSGSAGIPVVVIIPALFKNC